MLLSAVWRHRTDVAVSLIIDLSHSSLFGGMDAAKNENWVSKIPNMIRMKLKNVETHSWR